MITQIEEIIMRKQNDRPTIFDQIFNKIADQVKIKRKQLQFQASISREKEEELRKKIDTLDIRILKQEEESITIKSAHTRIENHIRIALQDVKNLQTEVAQFKERIESQVKDHQEDVSQKWSQMRLSIKQANDIINDLQKQSHYCQDEISKNTKIMGTQQEAIEKINRRIERIENIKLDEVKYIEHEKIVDQRVKEVKHKIEDLESCLKLTDNYLEKYQPFNAFCQLFEVLRITLEPGQINRVKDYEEYRLRELYDIILSDEGQPRTSFDKKYIIKPVGYNLNHLRNPKDIKLQNKNKKYIMNRPSFSSAIKLNQEPQVQNDDLLDARNNAQRRGTSFVSTRQRGFSGMNNTYQQIENNMQPKQSTNSVTSTNYIPYQQRSRRGVLIKEEQIQLLEQWKMNQEQTSKTEDDEDLTEELQDAIEDLMEYENEDNSSQGLMNLNYIKSKLFDPELQMIYSKFDDKIKYAQQEFQEFLNDFKKEIKGALKENVKLIEVFGQEFEQQSEKFKDFTIKISQEVKKQDLSLQKMQNIINYLEIKQQQQASQKSQISLQQNNTVFPTTNSRNMQIMNDFINQGTNHISNSSTKISHYNYNTTALDQMKQSQRQLVIRGHSPGTTANMVNSSLNNTFTQDTMNMQQRNMFKSIERPKTAINNNSELYQRKSSSKKTIVVSMHNGKQDIIQQN